MSEGIEWQHVRTLSLFEPPAGTVELILFVATVSPHDTHTEAPVDVVLNQYCERGTGRVHE